MYGANGATGVSTGHLRVHQRISTKVKKRRNREAGVDGWRQSLSPTPRPPNKPVAISSAKQVKILFSPKP